MNSSASGISVKVYTILCALVWTISMPLAAQVPDRASFSIDNDMWGLPRSDENYTMGVAYTRHLKKRPDDSVFRALFLVHDFVGETFELARGVEEKVTWSLASTNFTPLEIGESAPIRGDRPYASLLYLGVGSSSQIDNAVRETGVEIGVLGTNIGYAVQTAIHRACCKDRLPRGWDNQIGDGGSPTFLYRTRWSRPLVARLSVGSGAFEALWSYGANLGYYTRLLGGLSLAYGATPRDLDDLRHVGGDTSLKPLGVGGGRTANLEVTKLGEVQSSPRGFSIWLDYEMSLFGYNQLLQGAWGGRNRVRFSSADVERVVHRVNVGTEFTFLPMWLGLMSGDDGRIYWVQSYKSKDLKEPAGRQHYWGGFFLSWKL